MGFFDSLFGGDDSGGNEDASAAANAYFERIPGVVKPYYEPFINSGRESEAITNPIYSRMAQNPQEFLDAIMRNYTPSEGYRFAERNLSQAARNAAAHGGYAGTPHAQMQQSEVVRGLLSQDMQQYLSNILGIQSGGLAGQEARTGRGFGASSELANILGGNLVQQGGLAFQAAQQRNQNALDRRSQDFNFLGGLAKAGATAYGAGMFGPPGSGAGGGFF